jgi:hypothetical protein
MTAGRWKNSRAKITKLRSKKSKIAWAEKRQEQRKRTKIQRNKYK